MQTQCLPLKLVPCFESLGVGSDSGERSSRIQVGASDSQRLDVKNQQENIHWHTRYESQWHLLYS